ncbi:hypothetical protein JCM14036_10290 [Desulfotomaculum defluvii]
MKDLKEAIENIISIFNFSLDSFYEEPERFYLFDPEYELKALDEVNLTKNIAVFGNCINITIRNIDAISISGSYTNEDLEAFHDWVKDNESQKVQLSISLEKKRYVYQKYQQCNVDLVLYINPNALAKNISYEGLEKHIIISNRPHVILVPLWEIDVISNNYLTFIGGSFDGVINGYLESLSIDSETIANSIQQRYELQRLYCNMGNRWGNILPNHLYFSDVSCQDPYLIIKRLNHFLFLISLHFIANVSTVNTFSIHGYKNVTISFADKEFINFEPKYSKIIFKLYDSIYESQTQDKLLITRNVMSIYLSPETSESEFVNILPELFSSYDANYDSYIKDKIKAFFDKKKELEKYVRDTSETLSKQIALVSENVSKSLLTVIGALIVGAITYSARGNMKVLAVFFFLFGFISLITMNFILSTANREKELQEKSFKHFINLIDGINETEKKKIIGDVIDSKYDLFKGIMFESNLYKYFIFLLSIVLAIITWNIGINIK